MPSPRVRGRGRGRGRGGRGGKGKGAAAPVEAEVETTVDEVPSSPESAGNEEDEVETSTIDVSAVGEGAVPIATTGQENRGDPSDEESEQLQDVVPDDGTQAVIDRHRTQNSSNPDNVLDAECADDATDMIDASILDSPESSKYPTAKEDNNAGNKIEIM